MTTPKAPQKQEHRALDDGWIAGRRVRKGDPVALTEDEARYEPVEPVAPARRAKAKGEVAE